jgi:hypothetical protein
MVKPRTHVPALASARGPPNAEMRKPCPPFHRLGCSASALPAKGSGPDATANGVSGCWNRPQPGRQCRRWTLPGCALRSGNLPRPHPSAGVFFRRSRREAMAMAQAITVGRSRSGMQTPRHQERGLRRRRRQNLLRPPGNRQAPARARPCLRRPCGQSADRHLFVKICLELKHNLWSPWTARRGTPPKADVLKERAREAHHE